MRQPLVREIECRIDASHKPGGDSEFPPLDFLTFRPTISLNAAGSVNLRRERVPRQHSPWPPSLKVERMSGKTAPADSAAWRVSRRASPGWAA